MNRLTFCMILLPGLFLSIASVSAKSASVNAVSDDTSVLHKGTPAQGYKKIGVTGVKAFSLSTPQSEKANANLHNKLELPKEQVWVIDSNKHALRQPFIWVVKDNKKAAQQPFLQIGKVPDKPDEKPNSTTK